MSLRKRLTAIAAEMRLRMRGSAHWHECRCGEAWRCLDPHCLEDECLVPCIEGLIGANRLRGHVPTIELRRIKREVPPNQIARNRLKGQLWLIVVEEMINLPLIRLLVIADIGHTGSASRADHD